MNKDIESVFLMFNVNPFDDVHYRKHLYILLPQPPHNLYGDLTITKCQLSCFWDLHFTKVTSTFIYAEG